MAGGMNTIAFTVIGHPEPAGSKRAVPTRREWRSVPGVRWQVLDANKKAEPWKDVVAVTARGAMLSNRLQVFEGPLVVEMTFYRHRPGSHWNKKGLSPEGLRYPFPIAKPDVLKLARGVEDALTGIVYGDDNQIVDEILRKRFCPPGDRERVEIMVMGL